MLWTETFKNGLHDSNDFLKDSDGEGRKKLALAEQLCAWGNILMGTPPTEHFDITMANLGSITDFVECMEVSEGMI